MKIQLENIMTKQGLLSTSTAEKRTINSVRTSQLHILPKIHKSSIPGRQAVSAVECLTSKISKFVDH